MTSEKKIKFSILIPTRNRLELTQAAVQTVRAQGYSNWEIIIADNNSEENYASYIKSVDDARLIYTRSDKFISVTANWNRAIDAATGDYVVMLGDDDGLRADYFEQMLKTIDSFPQIDFIYHGAYHYRYPNTIKENPKSKLTDVTVYSNILQGVTEARMLPKQKAYNAARQALRIKAIFGFNMQHFLFNQRFLSQLRNYGAVFQGPFPDFYTANMAMLLATNIVLLPEPLVYIGISPKSYGYYHYNKNEKNGVAFLNSNELQIDAPAHVREKILPGSNMNTNWLTSVALVKEKLGKDYPRLKIGIERYRLFQIFEALREDVMTSSEKGRHISELLPLLNGIEKLCVRFASIILLLPSRFQKFIIKRMKWIIQHMQYTRLHGYQFWESEGDYDTLLDAYNNLQDYSKFSRAKK